MFTENTSDRETFSPAIAPQDDRQISTPRALSLEVPDALPPSENDRNEVPAPPRNSADLFSEELPEEGIEITLRQQFSPERFSRAMNTLNQYGPKEGLRRLKDSDPEVAKQVERLLPKTQEID